MNLPRPPGGPPLPPPPPIALPAPPIQSPPSRMPSSSAAATAAVAGGSAGHPPSSIPAPSAEAPAKRQRRSRWEDAPPAPSSLPQSGSTLPASTTPARHAEPSAQDQAAAAIGQSLDEVLKELQGVGSVSMESVSKSGPITTLTSTAGVPAADAPQPMPHALVNGVQQNLLPGLVPERPAPSVSGTSKRGSRWGDIPASGQPTRNEQAPVMASTQAPMQSLPLPPPPHSSSGSQKAGLPLHPVKLPLQTGTALLANGHFEPHPAEGITPPPPPAAASSPLHGQKLQSSSLPPPPPLPHVSASLPADVSTKGSSRPAHAGAPHPNPPPGGPLSEGHAGHASGTYAAVKANRTTGHEPLPDVDMDVG